MKKVSLVLGICLALLLVVAGCGGGDTGSKDKIDAQSGVSAAVALTEARVDGMVSTMKTLAITSQIKSCKWNSMKGILGEFENTSIPLVAWFALPDSSYYTVDTGKASGNLSDRPYFPRVMAGEITIGDLVVSKSTGMKSMVVTVPVQNGSTVIGALGVSVYLENLSQMTAEDLSLPSDMFFVAVDKDGLIAMHSNTSLLMGNAAELIDLSGQVASAKSDILGWTFYLGTVK